MEPLFMLCQQGKSGRTAANHQVNRLLLKAQNKNLPYDVPSYFQGCIRTAMQRIQEPPRDHKDYGAWSPGICFDGPHTLKVKFSPRDPETNLPTSWAARHMDHGEYVLAFGTMEEKENLPWSQYIGTAPDEGKSKGKARKTIRPQIS